MSALKTDPVVDQSHDNSIQNKDPILVRSSIAGIISAVLSFLVVNGSLTAEEQNVIEENIKVIVPALALLGPVLAGIWSRLAAYSPRSAATIAVENVNAGYVAGKEGSPLPAPTLAT